MDEGKVADGVKTRTDLAWQNKDYQMRPKLNERFQVNTVKEVLHTVLNEELIGKTYDIKNVGKWSLHISDVIKDKVVELGLQHYKLVIQVVIGEQRGEGVRICSRCLWDADTDNLASQVFINDTIFCMAVVFGIFMY